MTSFSVPRWREALPLTAWLVVLAAVVVAFHRLGTGVLASPPLTDPGEWGSWARRRDAVEIAFAILRLVVLAAAWYLLGVTLFTLIARLARASSLTRCADLLAVPLVRRLVQGALGVGLAAVAVTTIHSRPSPGPPSVAVMEMVGRQLPMEQADRDAPREEMTRAVEVRTYTVEPGDHLWGIADAVLTQAWGRPPSDAEVVPYWTGLIDANRDRLSDPDNPDLIFPGQVLIVPDPPPSPLSSP